MNLSTSSWDFEKAYLIEGNGIVERVNYNYLRTLLFDKRVHDKWSIEQRTFVQRIMNI